MAYPPRQFQQPQPTSSVVDSEDQYNLPVRHNSSRPLHQNDRTNHVSYNRSYPEPVQHLHGDCPGVRSYGSSHNKGQWSGQDASGEQELHQPDTNWRGKEHNNNSQVIGYDQMKVQYSARKPPPGNGHRPHQDFRRANPSPHISNHDEEYFSPRDEHDRAGRSLGGNIYPGVPPPRNSHHRLQEPSMRSPNGGNLGYDASAGHRLPNMMDQQQPSLPPPNRRVAGTNYSSHYGEQPPEVLRKTRAPVPVGEKLRKPAKEHISTSPTSPETMSWDNPFPTFPSSKTRNKLTGNEDFNRSRGGISLGQTSWAGVPEESRPSNGDGQLRHDPPRIGKTSNLQEGAPDRTYMRGAQSSLETQQAMMDPMQWVSGNLQSTQRPLNQPMHPSNRLRPQMDYGRRSEDTARGPSFRRLAVNQMVDQRSRTMPATVTDTFAGPNSRETYGQQLIAQDVRHNLTGHHEWSPLYDESPRPPMQSHSGSIEALPDSGCVNREPQALHPQSYHSQQASIGEVFDAYYHSPHHSQSSLMQGYADPVRTPHEEDMPNFDSLSGPGASHKQGMTVDDHLHSQQPTPALPSIPAYPPLGVSSGPQPLSSRSKSSPNLQQQSSQGSQKYSDGFDFELPGSVPAMYAARPQTERDTNALVEYGEEAAQSKYSEREQNNAINWSQGSARHQEPSNRPDTGESHGRLGQSRSPDRRNQPPTSKPFPPYEHQSGRARNGPSPANRMVPSSPPTGQSPNPDALPAHPTPIRPGLMTNAPLKQSPRPRPVRQYTSETAPRTESPSSPQPQICRAPRDETKSVFVTHEGLERLRQMTRSNPSDSKIQLLLARKLVEAASVLADEGGRADPRTVSRNRERVISEAYKVVRKLAQNGYLDAMFYLGDCYSRGFLGLHTDPKEAFGHYQSAAKAGHAQAAYRVAVCCEMGLDEGGGTKRDAVKAMQWYQRAATLGDTPAMYKLGVIQLKGLLGQPKNASAALTWLQRAAEQADKENPHALHELALLHEAPNSIEGIRQDEAHAKQLFIESANLGYKFSQFRLGCAFEYGLLRTSIDPRQSIAWYSKAAVQDEHQSELALSGWYLTGSEGVLQQSDTEAYLWARKAAQAGLAKAEYAMGYFTEVGIGTPANFEDAKRWYWRSASQNFPQARARLEDLRRGGAKMQKTRVSRSKMNKQPEGECIVM